MGSFALNPDAPGARTSREPLADLVDKAIDMAADGDEPAALDPDWDLQVLGATLCDVCERPLRTRESIARGRGPKCDKRMRGLA